MSIVHSVKKVFTLITVTKTYKYIKSYFCIDTISVIDSINCAISISITSEKTTLTL